MSTTTEIAPSGALSLFLDQDEKGQVDSTVPVRWCISRETAEMIEAEGILDPQLLIVIEQNGQELERYVVPLEDQMRYIQFRRPGTNVIHATVMWQPDDEEPSVKEIVTGRTDSGLYRAQMLSMKRPETEALEAKAQSLRRKQRDVDAEDAEYVVLQTEIDQIEAEVAEKRFSESPEVSVRADFDTIKRIDAEFQLDVVVPEEMFAKEPPRWMKWLGTRYSTWQSAARDQCDLRRRAIITGFTLPFVWAWLAIKNTVMFLAVAGVVLLVEIINLGQIAALLLLGARNINYKPLNPFDEEVNDFVKDIGKDLKPSFWWTKKVKSDDGFYEYKYELRHPVLLVVNPPVVLALAAIAFGLYLLLSTALFHLIVGIIGGLFLSIVLIVGVLASEAAANNRATRALRREQEAKERKERREALLRKDLEQLACSSASRDVSISALPKERRTVALRFQALKVKVCKPFAS